MSALARSALRASRVARARLPVPSARPLPLTVPRIPARTPVARFSTASGPTPAGPKWNARRIVITAAVSLVAFGSAGFGWHLIENLERPGAGPELAGDSGSPASQHDNAKFPAVLHPALDAYKAAFDAQDYSAAEAVLRGVYAAAAAMPAESFTGEAQGAVGKRRVAQELAAQLAEVVILQGRPVEAWILMREQYDALGATPFTSWPEGPVRTADAFDAVLSLARELSRAARLLDRDEDDEEKEAEPFPAAPAGPASWAEAVMYYDYAQAAAMLDLGLAHLAPEERRVHHAFRPAEEGEALAVLDTAEDPEYQEEARQHTATKFRVLGDALYRDDQRALAAEYLEIAYTLCDPASPLANHMTLLGAALAQEQLAEVAFVSEYLRGKGPKGKAHFTKAIRHLHRCLALLERSEELAESLTPEQRKRAAATAGGAEHDVLVTSVRLQTFYHLAMYEAAAGNTDAARGALADLNHLAAGAGTPLLDKLPAPAGPGMPDEASSVQRAVSDHPPPPMDRYGRDLAEVAALLEPSWWSVGAWFKAKETEVSQAAGLIPPPRWES